MLRTTQLFLAVVILPIALFAQASARKPIEGVWKVTEIVVIGTDSSTETNPQPSLIIFTNKHYSAMRVVGNKPPTPYKSEEPTTEEKLATFQSFAAHTGTYELTGQTLILRPLVARHPGFMAGGFDKYQVQIDANSMTWTHKSTDFNFRMGERVASSSGPMTQTRYKLIRVE